MARKLRLGLAEITARYFFAENAENADFKSPAEIKEIKEMISSKMAQNGGLGKIFTEI